MPIEQILQLVGSIVTIIAAILITYLRVKNAKTKEEKATLLNEYASIIQKIPELIKNAETTVGNGNGALKKTLVLQQIQLLCAEKGLSYENTEFNQKIEEILETPQKKTKDKEKCTNVNNNSLMQLMQTSQNAETIETNDN